MLGSRCERCSEGFYGNPEKPGGQVTKSLVERNESVIDDLKNLK